MKRTSTTLLTSVLLLAALSAPATAAPPAVDRDVTGPACLDITQGEASYTGTTLMVRLRLAGPACARASYTLTVIDAGVGTRYQPTALLEGNPVYTVTTNGTAVVEISATTSLGGRVFDVAPDDGSAAVANDGTAPGLNMR